MEPADAWELPAPEKLLETIRSMAKKTEAEYLPSTYLLSDTGEERRGTKEPDWLPVMKHIKTIYGRMKSGQNHGGYFPSHLMKTYAYQKGYSNEKRAMKLWIPAVSRFKSQKHAEQRV